MTNDELSAQFQHCQTWQDAGQWEALAIAYYARGYALNARYCFERADKCKEQA